MVRDAVIREGATILCLLEHKIRELPRLLHFFSMVLPGAAVTHNLGHDDRGRIAVAWLPSEVSITTVGTHAQFIHMHVRDRSHEFDLFTVYAYNKNHQRGSLFGDLDVSMTPFPSVVLGDFNQVRISSEHTGGAESRTAEMERFNDWVDLHALEEPHVSGPPFTWSVTKETGVTIRSRIDRCFVSSEVMTSLGGCTVQVKDREASDHCCLVVSLGTPSQQRNKLFRFYNHWAQHEEFQHQLSLSWRDPIDGTPTYRLFRKLSRLRNHLASWSKVHFGNATRNVELERRALSRIVSLADDPESHEARDARLRLQIALQHEEMVRRQESRVKWLNLGDANTGFFHRMAALNDVRNSISSITHDGVVISDPEAITRAAVLHHSSVIDQGFSSVPPPPDLGSRAISGAQNLDLLAPISLAELRQVVFASKMDSAPGMDGFNHVFFREAWLVVRYDLLKALNHVLRTGQVLKEMNQTLISLIPKGPSTETFADYRPISVCTVPYRLLSKVLAARLRPLLSGFVSQAQSAFIKGRSISEPILLANEIISRSHRESLKDPFMCLKIDLAKAFDSVDWQYLLGIMQQLGFSARWCSLISSMINANFRIKMNGGVSEIYYPSNGLRQGDPLSPYLFVIAMEGFSRMMERGVRAGMISPVRRRREHISHTLYADDLMIFSRTTTHSATSIRLVLDRFSAFSGLKANLRKCSVIFGGASPEKDQILSILQMPEGSLPTRYLGLPLVSTSSTADICKPLVESVRMKLSGWSSKLLSFAGRVALVQSVMTSMHIFWSSCFRLPEPTCKSLNSLFLHYIWKGRPPRVSWKKCCMPKSEGGLGLAPIQAVNTAALVKLVWRMLTDDTSLWARWVRLKYLRGDKLNYWAVREHQTPSWGWRSMYRVRDTAAQVITGDAWTAGTTSGFSFRCVFDLCRPSSDLVPWHRAVWHKHPIPRHTALLWQVLRGEPRTQDWYRLKFDKPTPLRCPMCIAAEETAQHLFVECSYAAELRRRLITELGLVDIQSPTLLTLTLRATTLHREVRYAYHLFWAGIVYHIWRERNYRMFEPAHADITALGIWTRVKTWVDIKRKSFPRA